MKVLTRKSHLQVINASLALVVRLGLGQWWRLVGAALATGSRLDRLLDLDLRAGGLRARLLGTRGIKTRKLVHVAICDHPRDGARKCARGDENGGQPQQMRGM